MGVFATRSPHRPNPFGITMARIERVDKKTRTLHLSACDLVQVRVLRNVKV
jgi:tRNA (Thr-GGU) A37 N-methylase